MAGLPNRTKEMWNIFRAVVSFFGHLTSDDHDSAVFTGYKCEVNYYVTTIVPIKSLTTELMRYIEM